MSSTITIKSCITTHIPHGETVILGLSGGPDSVYLLYHLLPFHRTGRINLVAAHFDHEWRSNSGEDALFCKKITQPLNIACIVGRASELPTSFKKNGSLEETGRQLRRYFLESVAREYNAGIIALAHHADDQQETFFIRLLRGTSLAGLQGIRTKNGLYLRPLLSISKAEILSYMHEHNLAYIIDESNNNLSFLRNKIRAHIIPVLRETDNRFDKTFATLIDSLQKTDQFLDKLTQKTFNAISIQDSIYGNGLHLSSLISMDEVLLHRIFITWFCKQRIQFTPSNAFLKEIMRFLNAKKSTTHSIHTSWSLLKKDDYLFLLKNNNGS